MALGYDHMQDVLVDLMHNLGKLPLLCEYLSPVHAHLLGLNRLGWVKNRCHRLHLVLVAAAVPD